MLPVVTTLGMVFSFLRGANVPVEKVFAWPGIGSYTVEALIASDYAPAQGFVLAMALLCPAQPRDRPRLRAARSAPAGRGMKERLRHARYVLGENPLTAISFGLFFAFLMMAAIGPSIAPYDPLASDTPNALHGPSAIHWFGTDQR